MSDALTGRAERQDRRSDRGRADSTSASRCPAGRRATSSRRSCCWPSRIQRAHGYVIEDYLRALGLFGITMSTLYRTLRQMEKDGFLESTWEPGPTGPARRVYTITDAGHAWLDSSAAMLNAYRETIDRFFGLYGAGPGATAPTRATDGRARDRTDEGRIEGDAPMTKTRGSQPGRGSVRDLAPAVRRQRDGPGRPPSSRRWAAPSSANRAGKMLETMLAAQKSVRDNMRTYLETMNVPTREDIARLGELVVGLEEKIDQIADRLDAIDDAIRAVDRPSAGGRLDRRPPEPP